jgi:hypothetical protein
MKNHGIPRSSKYVVRNSEKFCGILASFTWNMEETDVQKTYGIPCGRNSVDTLIPAHPYPARPAKCTPFHHQQYGMQSVFLSTTSSLEVQGVCNLLHLKVFFKRDGTSLQGGGGLYFISHQNVSKLGTHVLIDPYHSSV